MVHRATDASTYMATRVLATAELNLVHPLAFANLLLPYLDDYQRLSGHHSPVTLKQCASIRRWLTIFPA